MFQAIVIERPSEKIHDFWMAPVIETSMVQG